MTTTTRYPILDETGKAQQWLTDGRGIAIWTSHDIGAGRPDMLTPGDAPSPHWAYPESAKRVLGADDVTFYRPVGIVASWRETTQGVKAAQRALDKTWHDTTRDAPGGIFAYTYTLKYYTMGSIEIRPEADGGTRVAYRAVGETHPTLLDVEYRVGILQWSARLDTDQEGA